MKSMLLDVTIGQLTLLGKIWTQGLFKHKNMTFGDTYKEARTHKQEPPPSCVVEHQL